MHGKHSEREIWGRSFGWCAGWNKWKMEQTQRVQFRLQLNQVWGGSEPQGDGNKKNKDAQVTQCSHFVFGSGENNNNSSQHVLAAVHPGHILTLSSLQLCKVGTSILSTLQLGKQRGSGNFPGSHRSGRAGIQTQTPKAHAITTLSRVKEKSQSVSEFRAAP